MTSLLLIGLAKGYPGTWHHVMNRGRRRENDVFLDHNGQDVARDYRTIPIAVTMGIYPLQRNGIG